jgi:predicted acetyltransferase
VTLEIRTVQDPDRLREFAYVHATAFGHRWEDDKLEKLMPSLGVVNCVAAFDGDDMVGVSIDQPSDMTLPGGSAVPIRGITWVGVLPTHRRRGLLRAMIDHQHQDFLRQGLWLSALYASQTAIYQRFGYGPATQTIAEAEVDSSHGAFAAPFEDSGSVELLREPSPVAVVREVVERSRLAIPGELSRSEQDIVDMFTFSERDEFRVAHRASDGGYDGFVSYRVKNEWEHDVLPAGRVEVRMLLSAAPEASAALWRYLLDLELTRTVVVQNLPLDDPIRFLLAEWRHVRVRQISDAMWLAVHDVPSALAARRYLADGDLVLDVGGTRVRLEASGGEGRCSITDRDADIALARPQLASLYLGGYRSTALRDARLLRELTPGACVRADSLFRAEREPWCSYQF